MILHGFAGELGDRERSPDSIAGYASICAAQGLRLGLAAMGCGTFWQMTGPVESYVARCIGRTIAEAGVAAGEVSHVVFSVMDKTLRHLDQDFARRVLAEAGLTACMPALISMQQCASSLAAVDHARRLLADPRVRHVIVVAFDFVIEDAERIQPFALFGDAAASFMLSRDAPGGLSWRGYGANVDFEGLLGRDSFETRKQLAVSTLQQVLAEGGASLAEVERCFSTNFYKPIALFNAGVTGVQRTQLCIDTLSTRAHCGNCDWVLNLMHHRDQVGLAPGRSYLIQAFAPGFFGCALVEAGQAR